MARPVPDSDPALSLVFFLGVKALLRRAAAERLQASSPKHATKGEEGGVEDSLLGLGGGLGLESLRQLLGRLGARRRVTVPGFTKMGHTRCQKLQAATMPSSSKLRCTPS